MREDIDLIINKNKTKLYTFCFHLSRNKQEADDLFQDTWIKVFSNLDSFDESKSFEGWLYTIALNSYRDKYRKAKRWLNRIVDFTDSDEKNRILDNANSILGLPEEEYHKEEERKRVQEAISKLKDKHKLPLILYYYRSLSYKEIAEILGVPEGTIKSRINTAKTKLKDILEEDGYGR
ncbi:sigma-70 family RNA polymerase sigma factor [Tissierella carlieri]|uniref:sigma-70 family RNA polymerase sigma factor n=1 Tax=Tissierella carlieri TaxID=689904 RepID=UPI001C0F5135|nr:sigma-70 family RNA polymerase sigma factor [Tissierella carlieri]MBU5312614.1 sigma-70 family RNA polymerase sigma factor [Tissierella carlieri]MDU5081676.1 sigma-70 family RNA polymerase sigma factor [Bacillota bacterium]